MVVSKLPLATCCEFGDHATQLTRALWKPHSLLCASWKMTTTGSIINANNTDVITLKIYESQYTLDSGKQTRGYFKTACNC